MMYENNESISKDLVLALVIGVAGFYFGQFLFTSIVNTKFETQETSFNESFASPDDSNANLGKQVTTK